jgi:hypothetical protein
MQTRRPARRANLLVSGVDLENSWPRAACGRHAAEDQRRNRPCEQMEARTQARELMRDRWGGGAFGKSSDGGEIRVRRDVRVDLNHSWRRYFRDRQAVGLALPGVELATKHDGSPVLKADGMFMAGLAMHPSAEPERSS